MCQMVSPDPVLAPDGIDRIVTLPGGTGTLEAPRGHHAEAPRAVHQADRHCEHAWFLPAVAADARALRPRALHARLAPLAVDVRRRARAGAPRHRGGIELRCRRDRDRHAEVTERGRVDDLRESDHSSSSPGKRFSLPGSDRMASSWGSCRLPRLSIVRDASTTPFSILTWISISYTVPNPMCT
jgi:hypothetical protein